VNSKRFFYVMVGVVMLLSGLTVATVVLGNMALTKKTSKLTDLKLENRVLDEQKLSVAQAQKDIDKYAELERVAKQIVPQDKDQAKAVRELVKLAEQSGVSVASVSFPSSNLGTAAPAPVKPADGEAAAPAAPAAPAISQVKPVDGITGLYQMDITLQSNPDTTTFPELVEFLRLLESNRRTATISSINITPNSTNRSQLTFTMTLYVYIKP
jgi:hypothetical protein